MYGMRNLRGQNMRLSLLFQALTLPILQLLEEQQPLTIGTSIPNFT